MSALDPSYLRSIRDGILTGNIEANNNEALPDGLVGLYDKELFPPTLKWKERKETLDFFIVFALAQKEISADFAAEILGDAWYNHADENSSKEEKRLQRVNELIQIHSKRFSSAGGGKYRLYHERFRVYVLQKVSEQDIRLVNNRFISLCETELDKLSKLKNRDIVKNLYWLPAIFIVRLNENIALLLEYYAFHLANSYVLSNETALLDKLINYVTNEQIIELKARYFPAKKLQDHELALDLIGISNTEYYENNLLYSYIELLQYEFKSLLNVTNFGQLLYQITINDEQTIIWLLDRYSPLYVNDQYNTNKIIEQIEQDNLRFDLKTNFVLLNKLKDYLPFVGRLSKNIIIEPKEANLDFIEYANANGWNISDAKTKVRKEIKDSILSYKKLRSTAETNDVDVYNFWNHAYNEIFDGHSLIKQELFNEKQFLEDDFGFINIGLGLPFAIENKVAYVCAAIDPTDNWTVIKQKIRDQKGSVIAFSKEFKRYAFVQLNEQNTTDDFVLLAKSIEKGIEIDEKQIIQSFEYYFHDFITLNDYVVADALKRIFANLVRRNKIDKVSSIIVQLTPIINERSIAPFQDLSTIIQLIDFEFKIPSSFLVQILKSYHNALDNYDDDYLIKESLVSLIKALKNKKICLDEIIKIEDFKILIKFFEKIKHKIFRNAGEVCFYPRFVLLKIKYGEEYEKAVRINKIEFTISYKERFDLLKKQIELAHLTDIISVITKDKWIYVEHQIDTNKLCLLASTLFKLLGSKDGNMILSDLKYKFNFSEDWAKYEHLLLLALYYKSQNDPEYWIEAEWIRDDRMDDANFIQEQEINEIIKMSQEEAKNKLQLKFKEYGLITVGYDKKAFFNGIKEVRTIRNTVEKEKKVAELLCLYLNNYVLERHHNYQMMLPKDKTIQNYFALFQLSTEVFLS